MIQRIQTVWWLLSVVVVIVFIMGDIFQIPDSFGLRVFELGEFNYLFGAAIGVVALTITNIFLFKRRALQTSLGVVVTIILIAIGVAIFIQYRNLVSLISDAVRKEWPAGEKIDELAIILLVIAIVFQILAIRAVKKDEALIKSMDRLR